MKTIYTSVLTGIKDIKARNAAFHSLDLETKRKETAFDSLMMLVTGIITAARGAYWNNNLINKVAKYETRNDSEAVQCELLDIQPNHHCSVCARGAMMLSTIRLGNNMTYQESTTTGSKRLLRGRGFTMEQFEAMEEEYEHSYYHHPHTSRTRAKLANICCNVIINGKFKKSDKTDYLTEYEIIV